MKLLQTQLRQQVMTAAVKGMMMKGLVAWVAAVKGKETVMMRDQSCRWLKWRGELAWALLGTYP